jgi:hypothetical protein
MQMKPKTFLDTTAAFAGPARPKETSRLVMQNAQDLGRLLADRANYHDAALANMSESDGLVYLQQVIDAADTVFGLYLDDDEEVGFGTYCIKGYRLFEPLSKGEPIKLNIDKIEAIGCSSFDQAVAMAERMGDVTSPDKMT